MPSKTSFLRALAGAFALVLVLSAAAPLAAQEGSLKIAILNTEQVLAESTTGKAALEDLRKLREEKAAQGAELQSEFEALQTRIAEGRLSLAPERLSELERQLEDKALALRRFEDDANRELGQARERMLQQIDSKVMPIINAYAQEEGYDLIFRKFESGLIYADDAIDVTDEIIARLDSGN